MLGLLVAGAGLVGSYLSSQSQKSAAKTAAGAQVESARLGIEETRRQFDRMQELLAPYTQAGESAIGRMNILAGGGTPEEQAAAYRSIEESPAFGAMVRQSEEGILAGGSATGQLRGGNIRGALAQNRPFMLQQLIEQQYGRLGGIAGMGQASAAGVGAAGQTAGVNIANLYGQQGQARAGEALASGQAQADLYSGVGKFAGAGFEYLQSKGVF